jgi:hypothetical protein
MMGNKSDEGKVKVSNGLMLILENLMKQLFSKEQNFHIWVGVM